MNPQQLQELIVSYHNAFEQGQVTKEELISLLYGINLEEGLGNDAESLYYKEQMNTMLNAAISAASLLV